MDMPVNERRLNIKFINEHLDKLREIQEERQMVTADKPMVTKPDVKQMPDAKPTYTSNVKKR